jgi:sugar phosphate isomerase/epimerase
MSRPVTLFTGQWADLPLAELLPMVNDMGYDGVELACWGDHFDVQKALNEDGYVESRWELLKKNDLVCYAISNHLMGQAVCDLIDDRHKAILPEHVWGDGDPEGVRQRAAQEMIDTGKACRKFIDAGKDYMNSQGGGMARTVVNGFTGSSIWHALYAFPPTDQAFLEKGFQDFAKRWKPILDAFQKEDVYFALEVHPTEIAFDIVSAQRALAAVDHHERFGFNFDPSHLGYQGVDYVRFIRDFGERIFHVHMKDAWWGHGDGTVGVFGGHTDFGHPSRYWDFRSVGRGDIDFEEIIVALNDVAYAGPLSIEWEDGQEIDEGPPEIDE